MAGVAVSDYEPYRTTGPEPSGMPLRLCHQRGPTAVPRGPSGSGPGQGGTCHRSGPGLAGKRTHGEQTSRRPLLSGLSRDQLPDP